MIRRTIAVLAVVTAGVLFATSAAPAGASGAGSISGSGSESVELSSATAKAPYEYRINTNRCFFDFQQLRVRQFENGNSGTGYFEQIARGQVFQAGAWRNDTANSSRISPRFPQNFQSFNWLGPLWEYTYGKVNFSHRIRLVLQWWNHRGTPNFFGDDRLVAQSIIFGVCR